MEELDNNDVGILGSKRSYSGTRDIIYPRHPTKTIAKNYEMSTQ